MRVSATVIRQLNLEDYKFNNKVTECSLLQRISLKNTRKKVNLLIANQYSPISLQWSTQCDHQNKSKIAHSSREYAT